MIVAHWMFAKKAITTTTTRTKTAAAAATATTWKSMKLQRQTITTTVEMSFVVWGQWIMQQKEKKKLTRATTTLRKCRSHRKGNETTPTHQTLLKKAQKTKKCSRTEKYIFWFNLIKTIAAKFKRHWERLKFQLLRCCTMSDNERETLYFDDDISSP